MPQRKFYRKIYPVKRRSAAISLKAKLFNRVNRKLKRGKRRGRFILVLKFFGYFILFFVFICLFLFVYYAKDLPRPERFTERPFVQSTKIYDRTGEILLYELYGEEKREIISLKDVPDHLKNAVIATEDSNFFLHFGLDFKRIIRSTLADLRLGKPLYGGSTISQQLIRSTFLTNEKTLKRKIREIILTLELERRYSKDQILEWYLNQVPFGPNIYGVETASKTFFNKSVKELSISEAATLAALIKAPSYLSPYGEHKDELLARKNYALDRMVQEHYLTKEEAEKFKEEELKFAEMEQLIKAIHFVLYVEEYLFDKYGKNFLEEEGFKVYTTLDWELQEWAEKVVKEKVEINKNYRAYNASLVAIDPETGEILSMVGSADWFGESYPEGCDLTPEVDCLFDPKVNVATYKIGRQPGSALKPFVYATAFQKGYDDKYVVIDEETNFGVWGGKSYIPQNYDEKFRGPVTLREALAQSLNVPSVKVLLNLAGLPESIENARRFGITTLTKPTSFYGPSIVLGGGEVKLLDMVSSYGVFATEGLRFPLVSILKIEDSKGNIIEENKKTPKRVLEQNIARLISDILSDNTARAPLFGTNSPLYFENYDVGVKTGTTTDYRDAWCIGYTPSIVVGVWAGNNDNSPIAKKPGAMIAAPMWHQFMEKVLLKFPKENFNKPEPNL